MLQYRYTRATDEKREILFDAFLILTSKCFAKATTPVAILKVGEEEHRRDMSHSPSAGQWQNHEEKSLLNHPAVPPRESK